jgi:hypothetical protein
MPFTSTKSFFSDFLLLISSLCPAPQLAIWTISGLHQHPVHSLTSITQSRLCILFLYQNYRSAFTKSSFTAVKHTLSRKKGSIKLQRCRCNSQRVTCHRHTTHQPLQSSRQGVEKECFKTQGQQERPKIIQVRLRFLRS